MDPVMNFFEDRANASSCIKVTTYRVYIANREVKLEVWDRGPAALQNRFIVYARFAELTEGELLEMNTFGETLGNGGYTIEDALMSAHWEVFDANK